MFEVGGISARNLLLFIVFGNVISYILIYWWKRRNLYKMSENIPGPTALPLIGIGHLLIGCNLSETFIKLQEIRRKYGKTTKFWVGNRLCIVISEPTTIEKTIACSTLLGRSELFRILTKAVFGNGLLLNKGDTWRRHRKIISLVFHNNILDSFVNVFSKNAHIFSERLENISNNDCFDIYKYAIQCTMDIVHETVLGTKINCQVTNDSRYGTCFGDFLNVLGERARQPWLLSEQIFKLTHLNKVLQNATSLFYDIAKTELTEEKQKYQNNLNGNKRYSARKSNFRSILELFIESGDLTEQEILDETVTMTTTGAETTATTFSFVMALLGEHQDIQTKVIEEQNHIFGSDTNRAVTSDDLNSMTYLEQVVKETMRLFTPVPFLNRETLEDIELGNGYQVPKGAEMFVLTFDTHRDPELYPDPEKFDPERFSPENSDDRHPYAYIPFGGGRRICPGMKYAMMEMKTILSVVLRKCRIVKTVDGMREIEKSIIYSMVLKPSIGFRIQIEPRKLRETL